MSEWLLSGGEQEVEVVAGADEELGDLGQDGKPQSRAPSMSFHLALQGVVVDLGFKSAEKMEADFFRNPRLINLQMTEALLDPGHQEQLGFGRLGYLNII